MIIRLFILISCPSSPSIAQWPICHESSFILFVLSLRGIAFAEGVVVAGGDAPEDAVRVCEKRDGRISIPLAIHKSPL